MKKKRNRKGESVTSHVVIALSMGFYFIALFATAEVIDIRTQRKLDKLLKEQPHWVSISERKPKCNGAYIVTRWVSDGCVKKMLSDVAYFNGTDTWYDDCYTVYDPDRIVAWMPLPEPHRTDT